MLANHEDHAPIGRVIGKLSVLKVRQAKKPGLYGDGGGLFLQVTPSGTRSWVFRYKVGGKHRVMGLGPAHTVSLADAREKARECRKLRLERQDPIEVRRAERSAAQLDAARAITFKRCAESYITSHKASWKSPKSLVQWSGSLSKYVYPALGSLPVQTIDVALVM